MTFTSIDFLIFFSVFFVLYWSCRNKTVQNLLLLLGSYIFYGWVHPWFLILIAISTVVDYGVGLGLERFPDHKKRTLLLSLIFNLGLLATFKYFNFFAENIQHVFRAFGWELGEIALDVFLPVGISFYTFQSLTYTIEVYRGRMPACRSFLDFAVFVCFFPQLVSGPIERAMHFLPQIQAPRRWQKEYLSQALPLIAGGFFKKMVIADNVSLYVDKIFMLEHPSLLLLVTGSLAFSLQILTDFSGYTDIARGTAKLLGFDLVLNFNRPYLAISPSDFWRRWHISFSTWIRDYVYIPLGGSRVQSKAKYFAVVMTTMMLSGLWHGAAWHFIVWGAYHGLILSIYHFLGLGGKWRPTKLWQTLLSWLVMFTLTNIGWLIFRVPGMDWLTKVLGHIFANMYWGFGDTSFPAVIVIISFLAFYACPLWLLLLIEQKKKDKADIYAFYYGLAILATVLLSRDVQQDFIYFQF